MEDLQPTIIATVTNDDNGKGTQNRKVKVIQNLSLKQQQALKSQEQTHMKAKHVKFTQ